jgi:Filamin/ABP280 repeat
LLCRILSEDVDYVRVAMATTPSLKKFRPNVTDNKNGTVDVNYQPSEVGAHTLEMNYAGMPVPWSSYKFNVQSIKPGTVSACGHGLNSGLAGQSTSFTVVTKDA